MMETLYCAVTYATVCILFLRVAKADFWSLRISNQSVLGAIAIYVIFYVSYLTLEKFTLTDTSSEVGRPAISDLFDPGADAGAAIMLFAIGFGLWLTRLLGAGDAKLLFPIGLFLGWDYLMPFAWGLTGLGVVAYILLQTPAFREYSEGKFAARVAEIRKSRRLPYGVILAAAFLPSLAMKYWIAIL